MVRWRQRRLTFWVLTNFASQVIFLCTSCFTCQNKTEILHIQLKSLWVYRPIDPSLLSTRPPEEEKSTTDFLCAHTHTQTHTSTHTQSLTQANKSTINYNHKPSSQADLSLEQSAGLSSSPTEGSSSGLNGEKQATRCANFYATTAGTDSASLVSEHRVCVRMDLALSPGLSSFFFISLPRLDPTKIRRLFTL